MPCRINVCSWRKRERSPGENPPKGDFSGFRMVYQISVIISDCFIFGVYVVYFAGKNKVLFATLM